MSIRKQVLDEVQELSRSAIAGIIDVAERRRLEREAQPCLTHAFHSRMAARLPPIRWLARIHHRRMAMRFEAKCWAKARSGNPIATACMDCDRMEGRA